MLTATAVEKARAKEKRYFLTDQNGLVLQVTPKGQKTWVLRVQIDGKDRKVTLGRYPVMSLQQARLEAEDRRGRAESGQALKLDSFGDMGEAYIAERCLHQTPEHQYCLRLYLYKHLAAIIKQPINAVTHVMVLAAVQPLIMLKRVATAHRVVAFARRVMAYAKAKGQIQSNPLLEVVQDLPRHRVQNFAAVYEPREITKLLRLVSFCQNLIIRNAIKTILYTFVRTSELRQATWAEIDFESRQWNIPASHTKKRREQVVPLSHQMIELLEEQEALGRALLRPGEKLEDRPVFPATREPGDGEGGLLGRSSIMIALRSMILSTPKRDRPPQVTVHGFRSMASTILNDYLWDADAIEAQLAHIDQDKTRRAYNKARKMPVRVAMMQWWADYLDALEHDEEVPEKTNSP